MRSNYMHLITTINYYIALYIDIIHNEIKFSVRINTFDFFLSF